MRQLRWLMGSGLILAAACSNPAEPQREELSSCENSRQPCNQVLTETRDRLRTPFIPNQQTAVIDGQLVRR